MFKIIILHSVILPTPQLTTETSRAKIADKLTPYFYDDAYIKIKLHLLFIERIYDTSDKSGYESECCPHCLQNTPLYFQLLFISFFW